MKANKEPDERTTRGEEARGESSRIEVKQEDQEPQDPPMTKRGAWREEEVR